ncbi:hypothetical protein Tco_1057079 [Tanacetum coccineum]|uniref:Uncharacterized protein n=1 Tax=Tanacetum coccineum TaxID=301880 RepID=A0ABQ5H633_9ASTR
MFYNALKCIGYEIAYRHQKKITIRHDVREKGTTVTVLEHRFTSPPPRAYALPLASGTLAWFPRGIGNPAISSQMSNLIALPTSCGARAYMMKLTLVAERQGTDI